MKNISTFTQVKFNSLFLFNLLLLSSLFSVAQQAKQTSDGDPQNSFSEIIELNVELDDNIVKLNWKISTETTVDVYITERSKDGNNWEEVSMISSIEKWTDDGKYYDVDLFPTEEISYYRLKQIDFNGNTITSKVSTVNNSTAQGLDDYEASLLLFPNPSAGNSVEVDLVHFKPNTTVNVQVLNQQGRPIYINASETDYLGYVNFKIDFNAQLATGHYIVCVISNDKTISKKLVVR
jgi:hypothetical protein